MGDPVENLGAATENAAIAANQLETFKAARANKPVAILPGGRRVDASPFIGARYNLNSQSGLLGNPESIIKDSYKRERPGWHYAWPVRVSNETASYLRARVYEPVPFDAIDDKNPMAMIADLPTPAGNHVVWMQHILVAISPANWNLLYQNNVDFAISRTATNRQAVEAEINAQFGKGGFRGEVEAFTDQRSSKTGS